MFTLAAIYVAGLLSKKLLDKATSGTTDSILKEALARIGVGEFPANHTIDKALRDAVKKSIVLLAHRLDHPQAAGVRHAVQHDWNHLFNELSEALNGGLLSGRPGQASWLQLLESAAKNEHKLESFSLDRILKEDDGHNIGRFLEGKATDRFRTYLQAELLRWVAADEDLKRNGHRPKRFESFVHEGNPGLDGEQVLPAFGDLVLIFFREDIKQNEKQCRAVMFNLLTGQQFQLDDVQVQLRQLNEALAALARQHPGAGLPSDWNGFWTDFKSYLEQQFAEVFARLDSIKDDTAATRAVVVQSAEGIARVEAGQQKLMEMIEGLEKQLTQQAQQPRTAATAGPPLDFPLALREVAKQHGKTPEEVEQVVAAWIEETCATSTDLSERGRAEFLAQHFTQAARLSEQAAEEKLVKRQQLVVEAARDAMKAGESHLANGDLQASRHNFLLAAGLVSVGEAPDLWRALRVWLPTIRLRHPADSRPHLQNAIRAYRSALKCDRLTEGPGGQIRLRETQHNLADALVDLAGLSEAVESNSLCEEAIIIYNELLKGERNGPGTYHYDLIVEDLAIAKEVLQRR